MCTSKVDAGNQRTTLQQSKEAGYYTYSWLLMAVIVHEINSTKQLALGRKNQAMRKLVKISKVYTKGRWEE